MWECPTCHRLFKNTNQSHMCSTKDIGELFVGKPDALVLAYDDIYQVISGWKPFSCGASVHSIIVTSKTAWLIIKPMKKELDVKFYSAHPVDSERIHRTTTYSNKIAHHLRIRDPIQVDQGFFDIIRHGFEFSIK